ncbi:MAG: penicillin-binding protein 2, partial [Candidatus Regiella insecticola]|nr:penicillin-binding protein 2 [Candidatus Regiella insecticola]
GTAQVYSYETYNVTKIAERLRDHKLMTAFAPFNNPRAAVTIVLENGGSGTSIGTITRQILDYTLRNDNGAERQLPNTERPLRDDG